MNQNLPVMTLRPLSPPASAPAQPVADLPVMELTPIEKPGFLGGVGNAFMRGVNSLDNTVSAVGFETGLVSAEDFADTIIQNMRDMNLYPQPDNVAAGMEEIQSQDSVLGAMLAAAQNPSAVLDVAITSAPNMATSLAGGIAGTVGGGLVGGPAGGFAGGIAGGGVASAITEYGSSIVDGLTAAGVPITRDNIVRVLNDPTAMEAIRSKAGTRAAIVSLFDAASLGMAGRVFGPVARTAAGAGAGQVASRTAGAGAEVAVQSAGGALGEGFAQVGTDGQITQPAAVALEAAAEIPSAAIEVPSMIAARRAVEQPPAAAPVDPNTLPVMNVTPITSETVNDPNAALPTVPVLQAAPAATPVEPAEPAPAQVSDPVAPPAPVAQPGNQDGTPVPAPVGSGQEGAAGEALAASPPAPEPAPAPVPVGTPPEAPNAVEPRVSRVRTPDGTMDVETEFQVVDASQLKAASGDLQPRDRTRAASDTQIAKIAGNLDPSRLIDSTETDRGAPIVGTDGTVLSGNGRVAALRRAAETNPEGFTGYVNELRAQGFNVDGVQTPVLVRRARNLTPAQEVELAQKSNVSSSMEMSPVEQARADATAIDDGVLDTLNPETEQGVLSASNAGFVRSFLSKIPEERRARFLDAEGRVSAAGAQMIENVVFAKAFDDPNLTSMIVEDQEGGGMRNTLLSVAPAVAKLRTVAPSYDIAPKVVEAVSAIRRMRQDGQKPDTFLAQQDAFTRMSPEAEAIVRLFYNPAGRRVAAWRDTAAFLREYTRRATNLSRASGDLLGQKKTPLNLLEDILRERQNGVDPTGQQASMFGGPTPSEPAPAPVSRTQDTPQATPPTEQVTDQVTDQVPPEPANSTPRVAPKRAPRKAKTPAASDGAPLQDTADIPSDPNSRAFQRWFGDSRVVDENGEPMVVYHWTEAEFDAFDTTISSPDQWFGRGSYFAVNKNDLLEHTGKTGWNMDETDGRVIEAYLSISNPYEWRDGTPEERAKLEADLEAAGIGSDGFNEFSRTLNNARASAQFTEWAKSQGHDGVFAYGRGDNVNEIVAFEPTQIKSATDNSGEFDPENPSMLMDTLADRNSPTFRRVSTTTGDPVTEQAFRDIGLDPDAGVTMSPDEQAKRLAALFKDHFGFKDINLSKANLRDAIDNMLDGYRNLRMMQQAIGLPADALGLNGTLTLSMERMTKRTPYLGVYDPAKRTLTIPGRSNSFAHEYGHALDHSLMNAVYQGPRFQQLLSVWSRGKGADVQNNDLANRFVRVLNSLFFEDTALAAQVLKLQVDASSTNPKTGAPTQKAIEAQAELDAIANGSSKILKARSDYYKSAKRFGGGYWTNPAEMFARAFEAYVAYKMELVGGDNRFVTKGNLAYLDMQDNRLRDTFPKDVDRLRIFAAFDDLMDHIRSSEAIGPNAVAIAPDQSDLVDPNRWIKVDALNADERRLAREIQQEVKTAINGLKRISTEPREVFNEFVDALQARVGTGERNPRINGLQATGRLFRSTLATEAGMMRLRELANKGRGGQFLGAIRKQLAREPGRGEFQQETFSRAVKAKVDATMTRIQSALRANGISEVAPFDPKSAKGKEIAAQRDRLREALTVEAGARVAGLTNEERAAVAQIRRSLDSVYRAAVEAGVKVGYVRDQGYLSRILNHSAVWNDPDGFRTKAAEVYEEQFQEIVNEAGPDNLKVAAALKDIARDLPKATRPKAVSDALKALDAVLKATPIDEQALQDAITDLITELQPFYGSHNANIYLERILLGDSMTFDTLGPNTSFTRERSLPPIADRLLKDFYIDDPIAAAHAYTFAMTRKTEYVKRFGGGPATDYDAYVRTRPEIESERRRKGLSKTEAIQELTKTDEVNRLEMLLTEAMRAGANPEDIRGMREHVQRETGMGGNASPPEDIRIATTLQSAGAIVLLGRVVYTALPEPMLSMFRMKNFGDSMRLMGGYLTSALPFDRRNKADLQAFAEAIGIVANAYTEQATQMMMDYQQGGYVQWNRLLSNFMQRNLQTPITNAQYKASLRIFPRFLSRTLDTAMNGTGLDQGRAKSELAELGFKESDFKALKKLLDDTNGGKPGAMMEHLGTPYGEAYAAAAREFTFSVIQTPDKTTKPRLASTTWGRTPFGLLTFAYTFARNFHLRALNNYRRDVELRVQMGESLGEARSKAAAQNAAYFLFMGLLPIYIAQFITTVGREFLLNGDEWERREKEGELLSWLAGLAFSRSGALGPFDPIYQAYQGVRYQRDLTALAAGPYGATVLGWAQSAMNLVGNNSDKTNNTEYSFAKDSYRLFGNLLIGSFAAALPGGPLTSGAATLAILGGTSPGAADKFATALVGEKDSTVKKREREERQRAMSPEERRRQERLRAERERERQAQED